MPLQEFWGESEETGHGHLCGAPLFPNCLPVVAATSESLPDKFVISKLFVCCFFFLMVKLKC